MAVLAKSPKSGFVSLKKERNHGMAEVAEPMPSGPTVYIRDVHLPISEKDVGKALTANVKLKVVGVTRSKRESDGNVKESYDLELTGIRIT